MKVSLTWLQSYFNESLPDADALADALTFHAFEIEEVTEEMLDVKVLPDRAAYALSHRGIAREVAAILDVPLKRDPLREEVPVWTPTQALAITMDPDFVIRHVGAVIRGVTVGPSPAWLQEALAAAGQRSINNIVDILNYVMLDIGQPSGAFDAGKMGQEGGAVRIAIRRAKEGEKITVLTGEEHTLSDSMFVFTDATSDSLLDIAGIKGGLAYGITDATKDLFISVGTYDGTLIRRTSQALKLFTDASQRYQNRPSPELTGYGMRDILKLVIEVAGGEVAGVVDMSREGIADERLVPVSVSLEKIRAVLGFAFEADEVAQALNRLGLSFAEEGGNYIVTPPFERRDLVIAEDLVEEVGRVLGYDRIAPISLGPLPALSDQKRYRGIEAIRDFLIARDFTELSTQSFASAGDIPLANPLQEDRPYLRSSLLPNMAEALTRTALVAPRVLGVAPLLKLFEIGTVFTNDGEFLFLALGCRALTGKFSENALKENIATLEQELFRTQAHARYSLDADMVELNLSMVDLDALGEDYVPVRIPLSPYTPFSQYPFALRDVAVWTPGPTEESEVKALIEREAGALLARIDLFDRFEKDGRISYAFRLVFESFERTLSDTDLNPTMERITAALNAKDGWEVR